MLMRRRRQWRDDGSASLSVLWCGLVTLVVAGALGAVGVAGVARARAASSADLAAVSAAQAHRAGHSGCIRAAAVTRRAGAELRSCAISASGVVTVDVAVDLPGALARLGQASARGRAGPVPVVGVAPSSRAQTG